MITPGAHLGPYEITAKLGAGGMGEVWRAKDTSLGREVALKLLPPDFAADPERHARFEREARTLASLNHPGIATLYGLEHLEGRHVLVMELVEGEGLDELIARGAVPVAGAVEIARQIAEALEAAHELGVVHRDLKPANIRVRPDGTVKVLDFGLATVWKPAEAGVELSHSPTITHAYTAAGVILGTAGYMSPEQARGKPVDKRADIWAFGVVLYEMLSGRSLFTGDSVAETLAGVLKGEIDLDALPADTAPAIRRLLRRCLERSPRDRLHDIADARLELDAAWERVEVEPVPASPRGSRRVLWSAGIALGVLAGALAVWWLRPIPARPSWKLALAPPPELAGFRMSPRISPDGRSIAYLGDGKLWVQELDGLTPREVPRSEGATALTWSPDASSLAFAVRTQLWRTLANGDVTLVATLAGAIAGGAGGIAWTDDDALVCATGDGGLLTVPVSGGMPRPLLEPDRGVESDFHEPFALPGGRGIVFVVHRTPQGIDTVQLLAGGRRRTLFQQDHAWLSGLAWSEAGYLLVGSVGRNPGVWAVPLGRDDLEPAGEPTLVSANASSPSISRDGTLLLSNLSTLGHHQLVLVGRDGERRATIGEPMSHGDHASFSPDGTRVAVCGFESKGESVWVYDLGRGSRSRLWANVGCGGISQGLAWSSDGSRLVVADGETQMIRMRRSDGSDEGENLVEGMQPALSPDGRELLFTRISPETNKDLWALPLDGGGAARPLLATKASEEQAHLSTDGRYLAYVSDETGRNEVFLRTFPEGAGHWQVSVAGGEMPRWSADGGHLYYLQDGDFLMEVEVELGGTPRLSDPRRLFSAASHRLGPEHGYDPSPDGDGFVTVEFGSGAGARGDLTLVAPWPEKAKGR